jgi:catechol 2,3-dioxygenase-like lactoylglutathione lyase family enzyme
MRPSLEIEAPLMLKLAIPLLHVSDSAQAEEFYCSRLGFRRHFIGTFFATSSA